MTRSIVRRLIAIVALTVGVGVAVGAASAAADAPSAASSMSFISVGAHPQIVADDWWW